MRRWLFPELTCCLWLSCFLWGRSQIKTVCSGESWSSVFLYRSARFTRKCQKEATRKSPFILCVLGHFFRHQGSSSRKSVHKRVLRFPQNAGCVFYKVRPRRFLLHLLHMLPKTGSWDLLYSQRITIKGPNIKFVIEIGVPSLHFRRCCSQVTAKQYLCCFQGANEQNEIYLWHNGEPVGLYW